MDQVATHCLIHITWFLMIVLNYIDWLVLYGVMEGGENHEPPRFCIEVNAPRGGRKLAVLRLRHAATLQSAVEATVDRHCKTVCFNQLFGDVKIFCIVLSKNYNFLNVSLFKICFNSLRRMVLPFLLWGASTDTEALTSFMVCSCFAFCFFFL